MCFSHSSQTQQLGQQKPTRTETVHNPPTWAQPQKRPFWPCSVILQHEADGQDGSERTLLWAVRISGDFQDRINMAGAGRSHGSHNTTCASHCWPVLCCSEVLVASESHLKCGTTGRADLVQAPCWSAGETKQKMHF